MATTGQINGTSFLLYSAGNAIAYSRTCTVNRTVNMIDVTSKTSAGNTDILPGLRDATMDVDGLVALDSNYNFEYLDGLVTGRTRVMLKFSTNTSGDGYLHGYGYITSLSASAPYEDATTFSASFQIDGALTLSQKT